MATATATPLSNVEEILGEDAQDLLQHRCQTVASDQLHLPGPDFVDRVWSISDRNPRVQMCIRDRYSCGSLSDL